jgi:hypothetical protein
MALTVAAFVLQPANLKQPLLRGLKQPLLRGQILIVERHLKEPIFGDGRWTSGSGEDYRLRAAAQIGPFLEKPTWYTFVPVYAYYYKLSCPQSGSS